MADSPRGQSLNPSSQPFFPTQQKVPLSSDVTDRQITSSPVSVDHAFSQSSDEDFRVKPNPGALSSNNPFSQYATLPNPIPNSVFQDYKLAGQRSRESFRDGGSPSNRSSPPNGNFQGFAPPQFPNNSTPRVKESEDNGVFSPVGSNDSHEQNDLHGQQVDYQFINPISVAFHAHQQQMQQPQQHAPGSGSFGRPVSALRSSGTDKDYSSMGDSRDNSLSSSLDFTFENDGRAVNNATGGGDVTWPAHGFSLALNSRSSASPRSMSTGYDPAHTGTTRGTTPLSQSFEDQGTGIPASSGFNNSKQSLVPPPLNDRPSISRASSRSFSNTSQMFDRSPSSFDLQQPVQNFEAQAKASPFINDLLDRLLRCEYSTKEIHRELSDLSRKVNILVERAISDSNAHQSGNRNGSVGNASFTHSNRGGGAMSVGGTPSAQNGTESIDDVRSLNQRINTLTTSVGQLLALQTQAHMNTVNASFIPSTTVGAQPHSNSGNNGNAGVGLGILSPNGNNSLNSPSIVAHVGGMGSNGVVGPSSGQMHMLPSRPDVGLGPPSNRGVVRNSNPRQWPAGAPETIQRSASDAGLVGPGPLLRDKRKMSVGLMRRDSASTIDNDSTGGVSRDRDGGPVISKWEHLPLLPDLLRSIAKYGVGPPNKIQQRALPFLLRGSDIIAQAPPTQERIAAYIIPAIHVALTNLVGKPPNRGPLVVIISTTVDQATQAQRMIRDLGGPIGVRSALGVGTGGDVVQELRLLQQSMPHILCGTPQKLHALFTSPGGLPGHEVRFLVLDEVDQLIARNLHEFVFNIVKLFPSPRSRPIGASGSTTPLASPMPNTPISTQSTFSPFEMPLGATNGRPPSPFGSSLRRFSTSLSTTGASDSSALSGGSLASQNTGQSQTPMVSSSPERQTALFSNTVPQDVLNLANAIQLREPVRVLVRRDGNVTHTDTTHGARGLRQFYLYLAFTAGARADLSTGSTGGAGIIGSGRGATSAETAQAREWKLDALADLFDDIEVAQAIVHVGGLNSLESVVFKLVSRGLEAVPLHGDMNAGTKLAALNKFRGSNNPIGRPPITRVLVVYDVQVKAPDVHQVPLVINYDLPKAVEEYAHRVAPAISSSYSRAGVVINFVTATGGDVEMLRSIECFYKIKCPEVPMSLRDVI